MLTSTSETVRWSSPAASYLLGLVLQDRRTVLAATRALAQRWATTTSRDAARVPHVLNLPDSTEVHYRIDSAGFLIESLSSPNAFASPKRIKTGEGRCGNTSDGTDPDFVLLPKEEYLTLLRRSEQAGRPTAPASSAGVADRAAGSATPAQALLTEAARRDTELAEITRGARSAPADGTIPQEVLERAAQNHWQLPRAWREYLGLTKQQAAARASITAVSYGELEEGFPQICSRRKQVIASGLSLLAEQLLA